jgi:hypothetical protein
MGLPFVLKTRVKTSKLFALQASPYKGSKPRVNLDELVLGNKQNDIYLQTLHVGANDKSAQELRNGI